MKRFSIERAAGADDRTAILAAIDAVHQFAREESLDPSLAARLAVVVEEWVANVVHHGAIGTAVAIDGEMASGADGIHLSLSDTGLAFDPTQAPISDGPDPESGGGSGIALIRAWSRDLRYRREDGRNRLELLVPA